MGAVTLTAPELARTVPIDLGVAQRARPGDVKSGDRCVVQPFPAGVLLAVLDGLGHGEQAAAAAGIAASVLEEHASEAVDALVERCHAALTRTRGCVMSLASVDAGARTLSWLGVGNVEGVLARRHPGAAPTQELLLLRPGIVGHQLPPLHPARLPVASGDVLMLATDGVRSGFSRGLAPGLPPQRLADLILGTDARDTDDALVLVARLRGRTA
jgi:hypothetical protein